MRNDKNSESGFTLVELSIVLVIIGLLVGGVLVGMDLIKSSEVRSQISQIEQYQTMVNTFKLKYGYLPGDIPEPHASGFGFVTRGTLRGQGDGNGVIEGDGSFGFLSTLPSTQSAGRTSEAMFFWVDLSRAGLIEGGFSNPSQSPLISDSTSPYKIKDYVPTAKIGNKNYLSAYSGGYNYTTPDKLNYFGLFAISGFNAVTSYNPYSYPALTVLQAYNIDKKIDDGLPQSGQVMAIYIAYGYPYWAAGGTTSSGGLVYLDNVGANNASDHGPTTAPTNYATTNCYDNAGAGSNGVNGTKMQYQLRNGDQFNCALSFKFQ